MNPPTHDPIAIALIEDVGSGDITSEALVPADLNGSARIISRERAVVAGSGTAAEVFKRVDPRLRAGVLCPDGKDVTAGDVVIEINGSVRSILTAERVALNFLQHLSGIATVTREFAQAIEGTHARLLDTRKTTPGLRALEKAAVAAGGGMNHRFGLFDMVLVKDNHLAATRDIENLEAQIAKLRASHPDIRIEVEADNLDQVRKLLRVADLDVILLDNMNIEMLREAVALRGDSHVQLEASGGVNLQTVAAIARTGVDVISVGALTHSARAIDFSLELTDANR